MIIFIKVIKAIELIFIIWSIKMKFCIDNKDANPILAKEGQICPTNPKTLNFGQKYNKNVKTAW